MQQLARIFVTLARIWRQHPDLAPLARRPAGRPVGVIVGLDPAYWGRGHVVARYAGDTYHLYN